MADRGERSGVARSWGAAVVVCAVTLAWWHAPRTVRVGPTPPAPYAAPSPADLRSRAALACLRSHERRRESTAWLDAGPDLDEIARPDAIVLATHPLPDTDATLEAIVVNRRARRDLRCDAVVALCRPGNTRALSLLVPIVVDAKEDGAVRFTALSRLDRIGASAPAELRTLLRSPERGLDRLAAVELAAGGDPAAGRLVRSEVERVAHVGSVGGWRRWDRRVLCDAAIRTAEDDPALVAAVDALRAAPDGAAAREWDRVLAAFDAWLASHREVRAADAEAAARREAWLARPHDEISDLPAAEIEPAAAICTLTLPVERARDTLEALDRLAEGMRPAVAAAATREDKLKAIEAGLSYGYRNDDRADSSSLATLLETGAGNCMASTTLWIGLARRLGLPLRAVLAPRHVLVVWDDPDRPIYVETTKIGARTTAGELRARHWITGSMLRTGLWLRSLDDAEFVSYALSNRSFSVGDDSVIDGLAAANLALRLDPTNRDAWRRCAELQTGTDARAAEECAWRILRIPYVDLDYVTWAVEMLDDFKTRRDVTGALAEMLAANPRELRLRVLLAQRLFVAARFADCRSTLLAHPDGPLVDRADRVLLAAASWASGDADWRSALPPTEDRRATATEFRLALAERLVWTTPTGGDRRQGAEAALEVVAPLEWIEASRGSRHEGAPTVPRMPREAYDRYTRTRSRALAVIDNCNEIDALRTKNGDPGVRRVGCDEALTEPPPDESDDE